MFRCFWFAWFNRSWWCTWCFCLFVNISYFLCLTWYEITCSFFSILIITWIFFWILSLHKFETVFFLLTSFVSLIFCSTINFTIYYFTFDYFSIFIFCDVDVVFLELTSFFCWCWWCTWCFCLFVNISYFLCLTWYEITCSFFSILIITWIFFWILSLHKFETVFFLLTSFVSLIFCSTINFTIYYFTFDYFSIFIFCDVDVMFLEGSFFFCWFFFCSLINICYFLFCVCYISCFFFASVFVEFSTVFGFDFY